MLLFFKKLEGNDKLIAIVLDKLKKLNIYEHLNIIITSDHGMAAAKPDCKILVFDYIDENFIDMNKTIFGQVSHIYPKAGRVSGFIIFLDTFILNFYLLQEKDVYESLKKIDKIDVYFKKDIPEQYHFQNNKRIGNYSDHRYIINNK